MSDQAQFQNPSAYFQNSILMEDHQSQFINCTSHHQSDLTDYHALISNKRAREEDADPFLSHFFNHSLEIDALVHAHTQNLKSELGRIQIRQFHNLRSVIDHRFIQMLQIKEIEYESVARKNLESEGKIRQISEENQIWYNVMKNNEAVAKSLKATLDKVRKEKSVQCEDVGTKEGYDDSDEMASTTDDGRVCRMCKGTDVSTLVLPCRHLCLCKACEFICDTCPVCGAAKKASLQVLIS